MEWMLVAEQLRDLALATFGEVDWIVTGRMVLVVVLCGAIGLERSEHDRASGFRPHILVGLGACLMTLAGGYGFPDLDGLRDPMRVASYVVSGIGFLGAGAILRYGTTVRGLTTAASIWGSAGIGIAVGAGLGTLATVATLLILFTLTILERIELRMGRGESVNDLRLHIKDVNRSVGKTLAALTRLGVPVKRSTIEPGPAESAVLRVELGRPLRAQETPDLVRQLLTLKYIERVDTQWVDPQLADQGPRVLREVSRMGKETKEDFAHLNLDDDTLLHDLHKTEQERSKPDGR